MGRRRVGGLINTQQCGMIFGATDFHSAAGQDQRPGDFLAAAHPAASGGVREAQHRPRAAVAWLGAGPLWRERAGQAHLGLAGARMEGQPCEARPKFVKD